MSENANTDGTGTATSEPAAPPATAKPQVWEGDFDADRAAKLVDNLRAELADTKAKLKTREDAEKSELQRAQERAAELETALATAKGESARAAAIAKHNVPADLADLVKGSPDECEAIAERLGKLAAPADSGAGDLSTRPKPRLVAGHATAEDTAFDPVAFADAIRANRY